MSDNIPYRSEEELAALKKKWEDRKQACRNLIAQFKDKLPPGYDLRLIGTVLSYSLPDDLYQGHPKKYGLAIGEDIFDALLAKLQRRLQSAANKYQCQKDAQNDL